MVGVPTEAQGRAYRFARRLSENARAFADGWKRPTGHGETAVVSGAMLASAAMEAAFVNPEKLTYAQIKEIRYDETVFGCESALFRTRLRTGWTVEPPDDDANDTRHMAKDCEWMFDRMAGTFRKRLEEITRTAYRMGHSETERVICNPDGTPAVVDSPWGQRLVIRALKTRDPESITYHTDAHGNITKLVQTTGTEPKPLDPADFILYAWQPELDNPYGQTAYRPVFRPWFCKKWSISFMNNYGERKAGGIFVLKTKGGFDEQSHGTKADAIMASIQDNSEFRYPEELYDFQIIEPTGQGADFFRGAILLHSFGIAVALLAPEQLGLTATEGGSFAKADVQIKGLWFGVVEDLGVEIEAIVNEQIIPQYLEMNYPPQYRKQLPRFKFKPLTEDDKRAMLDRVFKAVEKGAVTITDADREWIRKQMGLPELPDDFKTKGTTTTTGPSGESGAETGGADDAEGGGDKGDATAEAPQFSGFPRHVFADRSFPRAPTRLERYVKFAEIRDRWDNIEESADESIAATIDEALTDILGRVDKVVALGNKPKGRKAVRKLRFKGQGQIRETMRAALIMSHLSGKYDVRGEAQRATGKKFAGRAQFADASSLHLLPREARAWFKGLQIGADMLGIIGETAFDVAGVISDDVLHKAHGILLRALEHGDAARAKRELREAFRGYVSKDGPYGGRVVDEKVLHPHRIEVIVRNNLTSAYSKGRHEQLLDPDVAEVVVAYTGSAILDENTTDHCEDMDGQVFDKDDWIDPGYHQNCRFIGPIPVFIGEQYELTRFPREGVKTGFGG